MATECFQMGKSAGSWSVGSNLRPILKYRDAERRCNRGKSGKKSINGACMHFTPLHLFAPKENLSDVQQCI